MIYMQDNNPPGPVDPAEPSRWAMIAALARRQRAERPAMVDMRKRRMAKRGSNNHKEYPRDDIVMQVRCPKYAEQAIQRVADERGMKKRDVFGRVVRWFADLPHDFQAVILGQVSPRGELVILDQLREDARARASATGAPERIAREAAAGRTRGKRRGQAG